MSLSPKTILSTLAVALALASPNHASPLMPSAATAQILKRAIASYDPSCGDETGPMRTKAGAAFADAATLARWIFDNKLSDGTAFSDTKAYSHYFQPSDQQTVENMMSNIAENNNPASTPGGTAAFVFQVTCAVTDDCNGGTLAVTDSKPSSDSFMPQIRLCPAFFDPNTPQTQNNLDAKDLKPNPGRRDNSWCQPGQPFSFFETAGLTLLHEMTHLDSLGQLAGLAPRDVQGADYQSHGTDDIYAIDTGYDPASPEKSARKLKTNWDNVPDEQAAHLDDPSVQVIIPKLKTTENAESYAAAATEFYFQVGCLWDEIME